MVKDKKKEDAVQAVAHLSPVPSPAKALETLFQKHHDMVFRAAYRVTGDAADAEDVLQTVFLRLLQRSDKPDLSQGANTYFRRAAINAALDQIRRRKSRGSVARAVYSITSPPPADEEKEEPGQEEVLRGGLRDALARLKPRTAEMFVLRYLEGLSNQDVAATMGTSPTAVGVTLFRTRHRLRKELASLVGGEV